MPLAWIALNAVEGLGPVRIKHLLDEYGAPEAVFKQPASSLARFAGVTDAVIASIKNPQVFARAEEQFAEANALGLRVLTLADKEYPPILRQIFAPPPVLFVKGDRSVFDGHAVAVVGTRNLTHYGEASTRTIVSQLARRGIVIVSGLARGIDTVAHHACLESGGKTIAVLGSGVDQPHPLSNRALAERIASQGALVSEFPLRTPAAAYNFPRRNRIISGLAAGVCVVEAGKKSGALITANFALQQGRDVFAVPGPISSEKSEGTINLIRSGAIPVSSAADIAEAIEVISHMPPPVDAVPKATLPPLDALSESERVLLAQLADEPLRMDQLADKTRQLVSDLFDILLNLELKGLIRQVAGQKFVKV